MEEQPELFTAQEKKRGSEIEDAITKMFDELEEKDLLTGVEKVKRAMLTKTAKALDEGLSSSKITVATANLFTKTMETLETLPRAAAEQDSMDAWDAAAIEATAAAMNSEEAIDADLIPAPPVDEWAQQWQS